MKTEFLLLPPLWDVEDTRSRGAQIRRSCHDPVNRVLELRHVPPVAE
jgi:hypothetical protein